MSAGPVDRLLDTLAEPARVLAGAELETATALRERQGHAALAEYYATLSSKALRAGEHLLAQRLLLAERSMAQQIGDRRRAADAAHHLAQHHRLRARFVVAEVWNRASLRDELDETTALSHSRAWRELAAIREVRASYEEGLEYCDRALAVCDRFAHLPELRGARVRALLQRALLQRLQGDLDKTVATVREARLFTEVNDVDAFTKALVAMREGGLELSLGRGPSALDAYRRAEGLFTGLSRTNVKVAQVRQITCLRAVGEPQKALELADRLEAEFRAERDAYRLGQVLLEKAEVLEELGDHTAVATTLNEARPLYGDQTSLEALRWHRHVARNLIATGGDATMAARHLAVVLDVASAPGRQDLTRTMLALFDLLRLRGGVPVPPHLWLAAGRAALLAADRQRDSLDSPGFRWSLHAQWEEVYAAGALLHAEAGDATAVARIAETGRADVLNQVLSTRTDVNALRELRVVPPPADPTALDAVFAVAAAAAAFLRTGEVPGPIPAVPLPGRLPSAGELPAYGDVVVLVQVGTDAASWWSTCTVWTREAGWTTRVEAAPAPVEALLNRIRQGGELPQRGIARSTWEQLGTFLFPGTEVWSGSRDNPTSVLVCQDPRLWQLPLGALTRNGVHLADVAELALTPSLRTTGLIIDRSRARPTLPSGPAVSVIDPQLPGHHLESEALDAWPNGHRPVPDVSAVGRASLLYVSGRGDVPGESSALGHTAITLDRLAGSELPPLVVLNGCWSGTAPSRYGTDPLSMAVGALLGGADSVVAGIGSIGGIASALVAQRLFPLLQSGVPVCAAVRSAQLRVREEHPELGPFDWAGLCVVGMNIRWDGGAFTGVIHASVTDVTAHPDD